jgi:hypothetical protein
LGTEKWRLRPVDADPAELEFSRNQKAIVYIILRHQQSRIRYFGVTFVQFVWPAKTAAAQIKTA